MNDESTALVAVRMRQQEPTLRDTLTRARVVLRNATKIQRDELKARSRQLSEDLKLAIAESDTTIRGQFTERAINLAEQGRLATRIAATDLGVA
jgi:hypothetical protein